MEQRTKRQEQPSTGDIASAVMKQRVNKERSWPVKLQYLLPVTHFLQKTLPPKGSAVFKGCHQGEPAKETELPERKSGPGWGWGGGSDAGGAYTL